MVCLPKSQQPLATNQSYWGANQDCSLFAPTVVTASQTAEPFSSRVPQWLKKKQRAALSYISLPVSSCPHTSSLSLKQGTAAMSVVCAVLCDLSQWLMGLDMSLSGSFSISTMKLKEKNNQWAQKRMKEFKTKGSYDMLLRLQNRDATAEIVKDVNEWRWQPQQGLPGPWHNLHTLLFWVPWHPLKLPNKPPSIILAFKIFF